MMSHRFLGTPSPHAARAFALHLPVRLLNLAVLVPAALSVACARPESVSPEVGQPPLLTWSPPLAYPPDMFGAGIEGSVIIEAMVDTTGRIDPGSIKVISASRPAFERPAVEMLRNSRFQPARTGEQLLRAQVRVPVKFDLRREEEVAKTDSTAAAALTAEGERLARQGNIQDALSAYSAAQGLDARLNSSVRFWYGLCWYGGLWGHADAVLFACDQAVALAPRDPETREARGLARAMTSDYAGAIEDLEQSAAHARSNESRTQWLSWIGALRAGQNPFTDQVLERLRRPT